MMRNQKLARAILHLRGVVSTLEPEEKERVMRALSILEEKELSAEKIKNFIEVVHDWAQRASDYIQDQLLSGRDGELEELYLKVQSILSAIEVERDD